MATMQFMVDIERIGEDWRLQADGSWRRLEADTSMQESDRRFDTPAELGPYQRDDMPVLLGGRTFTANATGIVSLGELCGVQFRVIRDQDPRTPAKEELREAIASGSDRCTNTLVIDLDGHFKLKPWANGVRPIDDLDIAVRMETFSAGNGYAGRKAAADTQYIDRLYRDYLWLWNRHKETGLMNLFADATPA